MDGDSAIPPYAWIAWQLRDAIRAGAPGLGEAMPSESELAARYGVSRMTAGKVLGQLAAEGLIRRRRGAGTVISVRLPTVSERASVNAPAFVPVISIKEPGSPERLYAADTVIVEVAQPSMAAD